MRASFTAVRKILLRGRTLGIPCLAYFALLLGYAIYQVLNYIKFRPINPALYMSSAEQSLYVALAGYAFFLYLGYELGVRLKESQLQEAVRPLPGAACGYMGAAMLHMALLAGAGMAVVMAANGLLYHLEGLQDGALLAHQMAACVLYLFLTPMVGGWMGLALGRLGVHRLAAYPLVMLLILLTTGYLDRFLRIPFERTKGYWAGFIPYWIKDWFTFTPYGMATRYYPDAVYGIPQEGARWCLALFWLGGLSLAVLAPLAGRRGRRWIGGLCGALALAGAVAFAGHGLLMANDERPVGLISNHEDMIFQMEHPMEAEDAGFSIESCRMELDLYQKLKARVMLRLTPLDEERDGYVFTLHRYLTVSKIYDESGRTVPFTRRDNLLSIEREALEGRGGITLEYSGSLPVYYANDQAAALPAFFPYYPMAGSRPVQVNGMDNTQLPGEATEFAVTVRAPYAISCNLPGEDGRFAGLSHGVTLMGSRLVRPQALSGLTVVMGNTLDRHRAEATLDALGQAVEAVNRKLGQDRLANPVEAYRLLFVYPEYFTHSRVDDGYIDGGDHLLIDNYCLYTPDMFTVSYVMGNYHQENTDYWLGNVFAGFITGYEDRPALSMNDDTDYLLEKLEEFGSQEYESGTMDTLRLTLYYALDKLEAAGSDYLVQVYDRLCSPPQAEDRNEFAFIAELLKEAMNHDA